MKTKNQKPNRDDLIADLTARRTLLANTIASITGVLLVNDSHVVRTPFGDTLQFTIVDGKPTDPKPCLAEHATRFSKADAIALAKQTVNEHGLQAHARTWLRALEDDFADVCYTLDSLNA